MLCNRELYCIVTCDNCGYQEFFTSPQEAQELGGWDCRLWDEEYGQQDHLCIACKETIRDGMLEEKA